MSIRTVVLPRSITEQIVEHVIRLDETGPEAWFSPEPSIHEVEFLDSAFLRFSLLASPRSCVTEDRTEGLVSSGVRELLNSF